MTAYIFLLLALFAGACKGWCGKKTSFLMEQPADAAAFNGLRMFLCIIIGIGFVFLEGHAAGLLLDGTMFAICLLSGISNAMFVVIWLFAVRKNAYMMVEVALMLGCLIPTFGTALLFGEEIRAAQIIGFVLLTAAVVLLTGYNKQITGKKTFGDILLLILAGTAEGLCGFAQQLYKHISLPAHPEYSSAVYNFYTYVFAFLCLMLVLLVFRMKDADKGAEQENFGRKIRSVFVLIAVMALCLFCNSYFQTLATAVYGMSSQVLYPFMKGGSLILSTAMSAVFFGEKITARSVCGVTVAFLGLIFINVLSF